LFDLPFLPAPDVGQLKRLDAVTGDLKLTLVTKTELGGHNGRRDNPRFQDLLRRMNLAP